MGVFNETCSGCFGDFFVWICRLWGIVTAVVSWGVGVETSFYGHYLGYYLISVACVTTFLELVFLINYCVLVCFSPDTCCVSLWRIILKLDDWKKGFFYAALAILCFLHPVEVWLAIIPGIMLVLSCFFYILKTFKTQAEKEKVRLAQRPSYDKFDDLQDDLEIGDTVINPHGTISIMNEETLAGQQDILEC
ncbi:hypothetical protein CHS0354_028237 [Potamilus streckersoni]|uniref:Transmembrane protein 72 n=1 Tax=Potamilus streckersoni TaxID=2493646 RepID=A0AAE0RTW1_9BIVA|nr:hypothetical protein CHS0354_028237 [Potamilus streckersoni]